MVCYISVRLVKSGITPFHSIKVKQTVYITLLKGMIEALQMWIYLLQVNKGSEWENFHNIFLKADLHLTLLEGLLLA